MDILRKLKFMDIFSALAFTLFSYGMYWIIASAAYQSGKFLGFSPNHLWVWQGSIGMGMGLWAIMISSRQHTSITDWKRAIAGAIGSLACAGLLFIGFVLLLGGSGLFTLAENYNKPFVDLCYKFHTLCFVIAGLCHVLIWSDCRVPENYSMIVNGRLLHPGERYRVWPCVNYTQSFIPGQIGISFKKDIETLDGTFKVKISANVEPDLEAAMRDGLRHVDYDALLSGSSDWIVAQIDRMAASRTFGQMLNARGSSGLTHIERMHVRWDGNFDISV